MNNGKVLNSMKTLDDVVSQTFSEVDDFMDGISEWAEKVIETVKKESAVGKESSKNKINNEFKVPLLLKTSCGRRTYNRKGKKNNMGFECPLFNSTAVIDSDTFIDTVSTWTRSARAATSKIKIQSNTTKEKEELVLNEFKDGRILVNKTADDVTNATYTIPSTSQSTDHSTRTKPVVKEVKQATTTLPEPAGLNNTELIEKIMNSPVVRWSRKVSKMLSPDISLRKSKSLRTSRNGPEARSSKNELTRTASDSPTTYESRSKALIAISKSPETRVTRNKVSKGLNNSPEVLNPQVRQTRSKMLRNLSKSPEVRNGKSKISRTLSKNSVIRPTEQPEPDTGLQQSNHNSMVSATYCKSPVERNTRSKTHQESNNKDSVGNKTIVIKKEPQVEEQEEKTPLANVVASSPDLFGDEFVRSTAPETLAVTSSEKNKPGKKSISKKLKREVNSFKENTEEVQDTVRITRTKSKAIKQLMEENENKPTNLAIFAKKSLNKAKKTSIKKSQLDTLLETNSSMRKNGTQQFLGSLTSKSKYHLLLSNSKFNTPLATLPNSATKTAKMSSDKNKLNTRIKRRDSSVENVLKSVSKQPRTSAIERESKLMWKIEKEVEAAKKRQNVIKNKQEELKRKNEEKYQLAFKMRQKLEQEKYNNIIQMEKEKGERHKLILQERQLKLKEKAFKKKMLMQQKIAETNERRRLEEETRIAKLKEMEAEEQRIAMEKQKELQRAEKRAQERLAEKKAREEYEMQMKLEMEAEKARTEKFGSAQKYMPSASKLQSATKKQMFLLLGGGGEKKEWDFKPRNENDYGLEDEHSEVESGDESSYRKTKPIMPWAQRIMEGQNPMINVISLEMMSEYMSCNQKSPDIIKMFKMTPSKRTKRTSSAIWNTPNS